MAKRKKKKNEWDSIWMPSLSEEDIEKAESEHRRRQSYRYG